jgi:hypothetical protein
MLRRFGTCTSRVAGARTQLSFSVPKHPATNKSDKIGDVPGDDYGAYETRTIFTKPVPRNINLDGTAKDMFDPTTPPEQCVSPGLIACLSKRIGITEAQAATAMIDAEHNLNDALRSIEKRGLAKLPSHAYGLVAVEYYEPEVYCIANFAVPHYEHLTDPDVLEAIHELTLCAAEMPIDSSSEELKRRFNTDWATDSGDKCADLMKRIPGELQLHSVSLLALGEFSANGHYVLNPPNASDFPNIGVAAAACCLDLTTGMNARFRFEVERIADSICEHVAREHVYFGQQVHLLKQPYLWAPDFSVEDFLRYKESLMQPAAIMHQLRYTMSHHHLDDQAGFAREFGPLRKEKRFSARPNPYRNLVELEELKTKQHELGKHYKENATPANAFTRSGHLVLMSSAGGENSGFAGNAKYDDFGQVADMEHRVLSSIGLTSASERLWLRYYTDSLF